MQSMMNVKHFVFLLALLGLLCSCASIRAEPSKTFVVIDRYEKFCVFAKTKNKKPSPRYLLVENGCEHKNLIVPDSMLIDRGVDLTAKEFALAIDQLREFTSAQCEKNKSEPLIMCLKGELPNFVSMKDGVYIFWYGRYRDTDLGGFPIGLIRNGNTFAIDK